MWSDEDIAELYNSQVRLRENDATPAMRAFFAGMSFSSFSWRNFIFRECAAEDATQLLRFAKLQERFRFLRIALAEKEARKAKRIHDMFIQSKWGRYHQVFHRLSAGQSVLIAPVGVEIKDFTRRLCCAMHGSGEIRKSVRLNKFDASDRLIRLTRMPGGFDGWEP